MPKPFKRTLAGQVAFQKVPELYVIVAITSGGQRIPVRPLPPDGELAPRGDVQFAGGFDEETGDMVIMGYGGTHQWDIAAFEIMSADNVAVERVDLKEKPERTTGNTGYRFTFSYLRQVKVEVAKVLEEVSGRGAEDRLTRDELHWKELT